MLVVFSAAAATREIAAEVFDYSEEWNDSDFPQDLSTSFTHETLREGWELLVAMEEEPKNDGLRRATC